MWPDANEPLRTRWIKASLIAAVISAIGSLLLVALQQFTGASEADGTASSLVMRLLSVLLYGVSGVVYGVLTGAVLQRKLPALPVVGWCALHGVLGLLIGILAELMGNASDPEPWSRLALAGVGAGLGAFLGAFLGSLQALVLRLAASGVGAWIAYSTLAYGVAVGVVALLVGNWEPDKSFVDECINQATQLVLMMIAAVLMIPAVERLTPRARGTHPPPLRSS